MGPAVIIVGLVLLVVYMARKTPEVDPNATQRQELGADTSVPATGLTNPISPAMSDGAPLMSGPNMLRLGTNFKLTAANIARVALPKAPPAGVFTQKAGPTQADSSVPTQDVAPTVGYKIPGAGIQLNTSNLTRKI